LSCRYVTPRIEILGSKWQIILIKRKIIVTQSGVNKKVKALEKGNILKVACQNNL
jgi:hypothetical protein